MRIDIARFCAITVAIVIAEIAFSPVACFPQAAPLPSTTREVSVRRFLQEWESAGGSNVDKTIRYFAAFVDLKDDGEEEVIVYLTDRTGRSCGSGGCTTLVLAPNGASYKLVSRTVTTRPPIRVLATKSHGWHDIAVRSQWGGQPACEVKLSFNGKSYPFSTSSPRAQRLVGNVMGKVVMALTAEGSPLY